jgi:hypothetical protein
MAEEKEVKKNGVNPVAASLAGAALGAAAAAGAIILSDKKNRKKLENTLDQLREQGFKVLDIVQKEAGVVRELASKKTPAKKASAKKTKN